MREGRPSLFALVLILLACSLGERAHAEEALLTTEDSSTRDLSQLVSMLSRTSTLDGSDNMDALLKNSESGGELGVDDLEAKVAELEATTQANAAALRSRGLHVPESPKSELHEATKGLEKDLMALLATTTRPSPGGGGGGGGGAGDSMMLDRAQTSSDSPAYAQLANGKPGSKDGELQQLMAELANLESAVAAHDKAKAAGAPLDAKLVGAAGGPSMAGSSPSPADLTALTELLKTKTGGGSDHKDAPSSPMPWESDGGPNKDTPPSAAAASSSPSSSSPTDDASAARFKQQQQQQQQSAKVSTSTSAKDSSKASKDTSGDTESVASEDEEAEQPKVAQTQTGSPVTHHDDDPSDDVPSEAQFRARQRAQLGQRFQQALNPSDDVYGLKALVDQQKQLLHQAAPFTDKFGADRFAASKSPDDDGSASSGIRTDAAGELVLTKRQMEDMITEAVVRAQTMPPPGSVAPPVGVSSPAPASLAVAAADPSSASAATTTVPAATPLTAAYSPASPSLSQQQAQPQQPQQQQQQQQTMSLPTSTQPQQQLVQQQPLQQQPQQSLPQQVSPAPLVDPTARSNVNIGALPPATLPAAMPLDNVNRGVAPAVTPLAAAPLPSSALPTTTTPTTNAATTNNAANAAASATPATATTATTTESSAAAAAEGARLREKRHERVVPIRPAQDVTPGVAALLDASLGRARHAAAVTEAKGAYGLPQMGANGHVEPPAQEMEFAGEEAAGAPMDPQSMPYMMNAPQASVGAAPGYAAAEVNPPPAPVFFQQPQQHQPQMGYPAATPVFIQQQQQQQQQAYQQPGQYYPSQGTPLPLPQGVPPVDYQRQPQSTVTLAPGVATMTTSEFLQQEKQSFSNPVAVDPTTQGTYQTPGGYAQPAGPGFAGMRLRGGSEGPSFLQLNAQQHTKQQQQQQRGASQRLNASPSFATKSAGLMPVAPMALSSNAPLLAAMRGAPLPFMPFGAPEGTQQGPPMPPSRSAYATDFMFGRKDTEHD